MIRIRSKKTLVVAIVVMLALVVLIAPTTAAEQGQGRAGFRALKGQEARNFRVPNDMQLTAQENMTNYGLTASRYRQFHGQAEVLGGQLTVYRDDSGAATAVVGAHFPDIAVTNAIRLSGMQAQRIVTTQAGRSGDWFTTLMINPDTGRYFYIVENRGFDSRWFHWVDAESGIVVNSYNGLAHGSGTGVLGDMKDLTGLTTFNGSVYELVSANGRQTTYDAENRRNDRNLPGALGTDADDIWDDAGRTSPGHAALVDAHVYANVTDNYYLNTHNFDWLNHYPQGIVSSAHYKSNLVNAYWNGSQMLYGDGDGTTFIEMSGDLDVVGHELSHGVTEATSNLIYQNESGALNEAFSDMMGTAIEFYYGSGNWTIGEDIDIVSNGIRSMSNPNEDGDPSHYAERYTGTGDNGGVHINSGIINHWFYLMVNGGQNANAAYASGTNVQGIGLAAAEQVAFLGFTALPAGASFCEARSSTIAVAGNNAANVTDAWDEVGVDSALCNSSGGNGALHVTVTTDQPSYNVNQTVTMTVHVEDANGSPVQGATASVSLTTPRGAQLSGSAATDTNGNAIFTYTPRKKDGAGTWNISASATKSGYTSGSDSTTFIVN